MRHPTEKIIKLEELVHIFNGLRRNATLATTNGCFDLLHRGHIEVFYEAKSKCDYLAVGVNSDQYAKKKGDNRPILPIAERMYNVAALDYVDFVFEFGEDTPERFLRMLQPDFHFKSRSGYKGVEQIVLSECGGRVILTEDIPGISSSSIIESAAICYIRDVLQQEI